MLFGLSRYQLVYAIALFWTITIFIGCSIPSNGLPDITGKDKLIHVAIFVPFGMLWRMLGRSWLWVLVVGTLYGILIEIWQGLMPIGREADVYDAIADTIGTILGIVVGWGVLKIIKLR